MNQHEILQRYINGLIKGYANSLIIVSSAGQGKSETTINALHEANLRKDIDYFYLANYLTPKALVEVLEATNKLSDPKILVIDEAEEILNQPEAIGVLKSALWEVDGERKVFWITSRERKEFQFNGKIIFILNQINKKSPIVNALLDRSIFFEFSLNNQEIKNLIRERAKQPYFNTSYQQRMKVVEFLT